MSPEPPRPGQRTLTLVAVSWLLFACGPRAVEAPPSAPAPAPEPAELVPADLDLVVRLELSRMRDALGSAATEELSRVTRGTRSVLLAQALSLARTVWIGVRPGRTFHTTDSVIVLSGRFDGFAPHEADEEPAWGRAAELGNDWRRFAREAPGARATPVRLYTWGDTLWVFATVAEIDSLERTLEHNQRSGSLEPPAKGLVSLAARVAPLSENMSERSPAAARLLGKARELHMFADLTPRGLSARLELTFAQDEDAVRTVRAAQLLSEELARGSGIEAHVAQALRLERVGSTVVGSLNAPLEFIAGWKSR